MLQLLGIKSDKMYEKLKNKLFPIVFLLIFMVEACNCDNPFTCAYQEGIEGSFDNTFYHSIFALINFK